MKELKAEGSSVQNNKEILPDLEGMALPLKFYTYMEGHAMVFFLLVAQNGRYRAQLRHEVV